MHILPLVISRGSLEVDGADSGGGVGVDVLAGELELSRVEISSSPSISS
jgi:hypothetical protein